MAKKHGIDAGSRKQIRAPRRSFLKSIGVALAVAALPVAAIAATAGAPRAKLTDHEVALLAELYDETQAGRMSMQELIGRFA